MSDTEKNKGCPDMPFEDIGDGVTNEANGNGINDPASRVAKFGSFYLQLVIMCGAFCAVAITVAVLWSVFIGILLSIITALIYKIFLIDEMKKRLGFFSRRVSDGLALCAARKCTDDIIYVPARLLWLDVTELDARAFRNAMGGGAKEIVLPATLRRIGADALTGCKALETVRFQGSAQEWESVACETDMSRYTLIFEKDGE